MTGLYSACKFNKDQQKTSMMGRRSTKENRKGHTQSYKHNGKTFITATFLLICIFFIGQYTKSKMQDATASNAIGTISVKPLHQIEYGAQSTPLVMIQSKLEDDLLQRFLQEHLYSCNEDQLNSYPGLDNRVKEPVYVYEGYYHSLPTSQTVYSKNPNPFIGTDFDKPAATPFTRAFYQAFRSVNKEIFDTLKYNLLEASTFKATGNDDVCSVLAQWIDKGYHFGDLSIQIHYGQGNEQKLKSGVAWHQDAENSLLHLSVTLRGERVLHSKRIRRNLNKLRSLMKNEKPTEVLEVQQPGNIYLSSSTLMNHAPQFFDTNYSTRVIAIHARILYTSSDVDYFRKVRTKESWDKLTNVLANTLVAADLKVPTLAQVESYLLALN
jgi:hypothetical protein